MDLEVAQVLEDLAKLNVKIYFTYFIIVFAIVLQGSFCVNFKFRLLKMSDEEEYNVNNLTVEQIQIVMKSVYKFDEEILQLFSG